MMRKTLMRASEASPRQIETGGIFGWLLGGKSVLQGKARGEADCKVIARN